MLGIASSFGFLRASPGQNSAIFLGIRWGYQRLAFGLSRSSVAFGMVVKLVFFNCTDCGLLSYRRALGGSHARDLVGLGVVRRWLCRLAEQRSGRRAAERGARG